jgi:CheY-like chemotaxis protein
VARLLVVEDDERQLELRRLLLEAAGHEVLIAENGADAIALLGGGCLPQILLMDLRIPTLRDGLELIRSAQAQPQPPKIVVLSGCPLALLDQPEQHAVAKVLAKPIRTQYLLEAIQELLADLPA